MIYLAANKYKLREAEIGDEDQALKASYCGNAIEQFAEWYSKQS